jgi:hypothetical protein
MLHYGGRVRRALLELFPNIGFDSSKMSVYQCMIFCSISILFPFKQKSIAWRDIRKRRKFFVQYAIENGFDPYNPENWYSQTKDLVLSNKVCDCFLFLLIMLNVI